jgi:hypothetical protein
LGRLKVKVRAAAARSLEVTLVKLAPPFVESWTAWAETGPVVVQLTVSGWPEVKVPPAGTEIATVVPTGTGIGWMLNGALSPSATGAPAEPLATTLTRA